MNTLRRSGWRAGLLGLGLVAMALTSHALTLGRIRGAAWIGQPLDLTVSVELEAGAGPGALCQEVEVFYADSRQEASRVRTTLEPTAQANVVNLRIFSAPLIDEPVVTVYVRAGCAQKTSRRYVLLADYANESVNPASSRVVTPVAPQVPSISVVDTQVVQPPPATSPASVNGGNPAGATASAAASPPATAPVPAPQPAAVSAPASTAATPPASMAAAPPASTAATPPAGAVVAPAPAASPLAAPAPPASPAAALKPAVPPQPAKPAAPPKPASPPPPAKATPAPSFSSAPERQVQVAAAPAAAPSSAAAPQPPKPAVSKPAPPKPVAPKPEAPAKAAPVPQPEAAKPRLKLDPVEPAPDKPAAPSVAVELPTANPGDSQADSRQMEDLQASVRALLEQSAKNEATLLALRERLEKAESDRVPMTLVYALAALLVLAMGAVVYLWGRRMDAAAAAARAAEDETDDAAVATPGPAQGTPSKD